jgi:hypothetical protein
MIDNKEIINYSFIYIYIFFFKDFLVIKWRDN